jgi:hypothetical protein
MLHHPVDDIENNRVHRTFYQIIVRSKLDIFQGLPQVLCVSDVDSNEFEDPVLCNDTRYHCPPGLAVAGYKRYSAGSRCEQLAASLVEGSLWTDGDGLWGSGTNVTFDICGEALESVVKSDGGCPCLPLRLLSVKASISESLVGFCQ